MLYTVILGSIVGLIIWGFLRIMNYGIEFLWEYLPSPYRNCRYEEPQKISADNFVCACCPESIFQKPEHSSFLSYCSHLGYADNKP